MKTSFMKTRSLTLIKAMLIFSNSVFLGIHINAKDDHSSKTLFGSDTEIGFVWSSEIKINSIQDELGTLFSVYAGALINKSWMLGGAIGTNLGHPTVNYSYLGLMTQYTYKPNNLIHPSFQVLLAAASTKDYQRPKSSLFDNYMNTSGENFYFVEPGLI